MGSLIDCASCQRKSNEMVYMIVWLRFGFKITRLKGIEPMFTVPFHSIQQSHITGPSKMLKCHGCHSNFYGMLNSFGNHVSNIEIFFIACSAKVPKISQKFGYVTATLGGRWNQIFGRPVMHHGPWWIDWNGTVLWQGCGKVLNLFFPIMFRLIWIA